MSARASSERRVNGQRRGNIAVIVEIVNLQNLRYY